MLLTGLEGRSSVIEPVTLPYIHVSSANISFASQEAVPSMIASIAGGNTSLHFANAGLTQL